MWLELDPIAVGKPSALALVSMERQERLAGRRGMGQSKGPIGKAEARRLNALAVERAGRGPMAIGARVPYVHGAQDMLRV